LGELLKNQKILKLVVEMAVNLVGVLDVREIVVEMAVKVVKVAWVVAESG
jgi:hypothetical protein